MGTECFLSLSNVLLMLSLSTKPGTTQPPFPLHSSVKSIQPGCSAAECDAVSSQEQTHTPILEAPALPRARGYCNCALSHAVSNHPPLSAHHVTM